MRMTSASGRTLPSSLASWHHTRAQRRQQSTLCSRRCGALFGSCLCLSAVWRFRRSDCVAEARNGTFDLSVPVGRGLRRHWAYNIGFELPCPFALRRVSVHPVTAPQARGENADEPSSSNVISLTSVPWPHHCCARAWLGSCRRQRRRRIGRRQTPTLLSHPIVDQGSAIHLTSVQRCDNSFAHAGGRLRR